MMKHNSLLRLWGKPLLIALLSIAGLVAALMGDGIWDIFSWLALGIPVIMIIRSYYFKQDRG